MSNIQRSGALKKLSILGRRAGAFNDVPYIEELGVMLSRCLQKNSDEELTPREYTAAYFLALKELEGLSSSERDMLRMLMMNVARYIASAEFSEGVFDVLQDLVAVLKSRITHH